MRKARMTLTVVLYCTILLPTPTSASNPRITLNFWTPDNPSYLRPALEAFKAANPDIDVIHTAFSWETITDKVSVAIAAGSPPDLFVHGTGGVVSFASLGLLLPVDEFLRTSGLGRDIFPTYLEAARWQGQTYGVPWTGSGSLMVVSRRILEESGFDIDSLPTDWDSTGILARKLVQIDSAGKVSRTGFDLPYTGGSVMHVFTTLMRQYESPIFSPDLKTALFNSTEARLALDTYVRMIQQYQVTAPGAPAGASGLVAGKVAMAWATSGILKTLWASDPENKDNWYVRTLPYARRKVYFGGGNTLMIPRNSKHADAAMRLVRFLLSSDVAKLSLADLLFQPRYSLAREPFMRDNQQAWQAFVAFEYAQPSPAHPKWVQIYPHIDRIIGQAVRGETGPAQALEDLNAIANGILSGS